MVLEIVRETLLNLDAPAAPRTKYGNGPLLVSPTEPTITRQIEKMAVKFGRKMLWTSTPAANFVPNPVDVNGTFSGKFSDRSYDVSWSIKPATSPEDVVEMKRLENENSGGWQTVRHFLGASFVAGADWFFRIGKEKFHIVLVCPESEYKRLTSLQYLVPTESDIVRMVVNPAEATADQSVWTQVIDRKTGKIEPKTRSQVGSLFPKIPSQAKSFVGLFNRPGVIEVRLQVRSMTVNDYRAIIYSVESFDYDISWPDMPESSPRLEDWWP